MSRRVHTFLLLLTVIAVVIFSAVGPTIVFADGGTSSGTGANGNDSSECSSTDEAENTKDCSSTDSSTNGNDSSECSSTDEAVNPDNCSSNESENVANASNTGDSENNSNDENESENVANTSNTGDSENNSNAESDLVAESQPAEPVVEETGSSILSDVPENTSVTVLNADGQPEPLATESAANAITTTSDPIWCPQGQPPIPGANGCTASFTSFDALLTFLSGNASYQGAGTIFVQQGAYNGGESSIDFNSYNLGNISNSDLSVQGGWNTTTNIVDPTTTSDFGISILIGSSANPWGGSLTINNIIIRNTSDTGLVVYSQNDINVSNVQVINSANGGGAELNAGGNVTVNNSNFLRNKTTGASIHAGGNVAIANSEFSNPSNAHVQNTGLEVFSPGSVSLFNVLVNENRKAGAYIEAGGKVTIGSSVFSNNMSLNGTFYGYGLQVVTPNAIDLANVTANNNFLWGADLDAGGDVAVTDSIFNNNSTFSNTFIDDTGLLITSGGTVSLNNVQADNNRLIGAVIDAVGDISVNNSTFNNNSGVTTNGNTSTYHGYGLQAVSLGSIFLNNVNASDNTLFGAHLEAGGDVAIANSNFSNQTSGSSTDQTGRGLEVMSGSTVFLTNVVMDNNQLFGGSIQVTGDVSLDTITATNNGGDGVQITANCTDVADGTYSGNGQYGLNLTNPALALSGTPTFANNIAGDIFPANPATCTPSFSPTPPVDNNGGSSSSVNTSSSSINTSNSGANSSNLIQFVSYTITPGGEIATSFSNPSVNSVWFGSSSKTSTIDITSNVFSGKYIFIYSSSDGTSSIAGLQIIAIVPVL